MRRPQRLRPVKDFSIPPRNYSEAESFTTALKNQYSMLGETLVFLRSPQAVADYLNAAKFRPSRPIKRENVYSWMQRCKLWYSKPKGPTSKSFITTNLHLFAFLWTFHEYSPRPKLTIVMTDFARLPADGFERITNLEEIGSHDEKP